ncbi:hypothetical protein HALLA_20710 (plasmid) [Halostagnicola larsenii XH-48]|uniref:Uncharacterized protein n=1 Tax=Halostagnicola larsenii XH-48 TaxID=797299 RepID=W0JYK7_9EURY|nr:hypothetical protein [Halostagnicola larsenii]AHG02327.1 hypothetical protein HALLA_20710 [Halostagnicola larsenii XH-48]
MNEHRRFDRENPWLFVFVNVVVGIVVVSAIQTLLFDGSLTGALIEGTALGLACGVTLFYLRDNTVRS